MPVGLLTYASRNHTRNEYLRGLDPAEFAYPIYLALFTTDPGAVGDMSGEVTAADYARVAITFGAPATPGVFANDAPASFPVALTGWGTIGWVGIVDSAVTGGGLMIGQGLLAAPITVVIGDVIVLPMGFGIVTFL